MSQAQKYRVADYVAALQNKVLDYAQQPHEFIPNKHEDDDIRPPTPGYDAVFHWQFRKGDTCLEDEIRQRALRFDIYAQDKVTVQAPTDWNVQAVVDEDQL